ncbi:hypothetical protein VCV18_005898 [Metarhizium anisopliae]
MASLRNIMNVDADDDHANSHSLKAAMDTGSRSSQHPAASMGSVAYGQGSDYSMNASPSRSQRLSPPTRSLHSLPVDQHPPGMAYGGYPGSRNPHDRRQSNASADSMDSHYSQGQVYGHGTSGSFSTTPMRPFVPQQEVPVKLTPITGRSLDVIKCFTGGTSSSAINNDMTRMIALESQITANHLIVLIPKEAAEDHPVILVLRKDH